MRWTPERAVRVRVLAEVESVPLVAAVAFLVLFDLDLPI